MPANATPTYAIGVDIGSTATKCAVMRGCELVRTIVVPTGYSSVDAYERVWDELHAAGIGRDDARLVATGYGRVAVADADKSVTEITCHGRGAAYLYGPDGCVIDIGGQDTKVIQLKGGRVIRFEMNDKCSAGTGKFLEVMASRLGVRPEELSGMAGRSTGEVTIGSMCTVFAESEVISLIGAGVAREDIARAIIASIAAKVVPLVGDAPAPYYLTGGLCENAYLLTELARLLRSEVGTCAQARYAGAIGAALSC